MKNASLFIFIILIVPVLKGGVLDRWGINAGFTRSNQHWNEYYWEGRDYFKDPKLGFTIHLNAEKDILKWLSLRMGAGYTQKGFKENNELFFSDGTNLGIYGQKLKMNYAVFNLNLKIQPLKGKKFSPYLYFGANANYLVSHNNIIGKEQGSGIEYSIYDNLFKFMKNPYYGSIAGIGADIKGKYYFELDFNKSFGVIYNYQYQKVREFCWSLRMGANISEFLKK